MGEKVDAEPVSGRAILGQTLRVLREKAGKSLGQLAEDTGYEKSYLSRLESGQRLSKVTVMEDLDGYYGTGDLLLSHWKAARLDAFKDQYKAYMALEATARIMWVFSLGIPGLLQTEDFTREVLSGAQTTADGDEAVEEQVAARRGQLSTMLTELLSMAADGRLDPMLTRTVALEDVPAALTELSGRRVRGKLVQLFARR